MRSRLTAPAGAFLAVLALGACESAEVEQAAPFSISHSASYRVAVPPLTPAEHARVVDEMRVLTEATRERDWRSADTRIRRMLDAQTSDGARAHLEAMAAVHMLGTYFADGTLSAEEAGAASFYADRLLACENVRSAGLNRALVGLKAHWEPARFAAAADEVLASADGAAAKNAAVASQDDGLSDGALTAERQEKARAFEASVERLRAVR